MATKKSSRVAPQLKTLDAYLGNSSLKDASTLPIDNILLPKKQPRNYFDTEKIDQLVKSISEHGVLEPLLVRPLSGGKYELVAGERRLRAASQAGLDAVPVISKELDDQQALQVSLMENLQREDLNPLEETEAVLDLLALSLQVKPNEIVSILHSSYNAKQRGQELNQNVLIQLKKIENLLVEVGRFSSGTFRSSRLPLLNLPSEILTALRSGKIEYTKAQAISRIKDDKLRKRILKEAIEKKLSLSQIREKARSLPNKDESVGSLQCRMKQVYLRFKKTKTLEDPRKKKKIEKLMDQLESLLSDD
ncbi:ParB/RepB/Spo0J family partition protein [Acaryochloris marina NIES-2412]|uniref:ParB/RepB/Spo0J family partition protein n=1 Tax=Acaryochloris marina TaxID=155978 RepID=UPI004058DB53